MLEFNYTGSGLAVNVPFELDSQISSLAPIEEAVTDLKDWGSLKVGGTPEQIRYEFDYRAVSSRQGEEGPSDLDHMARIISTLSWGCERQQAAPEFFCQLAYGKDKGNGFPRLTSVSIKRPDHDLNIIQHVAERAMRVTISQLGHTWYRLQRNKAVAKISDSDGLMLRVEMGEGAGSALRGNPEPGEMESRLEAHGHIKSTYEQIICLTGAVAIADMARD